jgi:hypothetical protein
MTWGQALGYIRKLSPDAQPYTKVIYNYIKRKQIEEQKYKDVALAAFHVHQLIWFYGENNEFPPGLTILPILDEVLSDALSRIPPITEGE